MIASQVVRKHSFISLFVPFTNSSLGSLPEEICKTYSICKILGPSCQVASPVSAVIYSSEVAVHHRRSRLLSAASLNLLHLT